MTIRDLILENHNGTLKGVKHLRKNAHLLDVEIPELDHYLVDENELELWAVCEKGDVIATFHKFKYHTESEWSFYLNAGMEGFR